MTIAIKSTSNFGEDSRDYLVGFSFYSDGDQKERRRLASILRWIRSERLAGSFDVDVRPVRLVRGRRFWRREQWRTKRMRKKGV